jgi:hypothetical protein
MAWGCAGKARTAGAPGTAGATEIGTGGGGGSLAPGNTGGAGEAGVPATSETAGEAGAAGLAADPTAAGLRPLRLLTRREYLATARDLLGSPVVLPELPADEQDLDSGFAFHSTGSVAPEAALQYRAAAEALAAAAFTSIASWLPCTTTISSADSESACLAAFFGPSGFASKIYRRPLATLGDASEVTRLTALYQTGRSALGLGVSDSFSLVVEAMLQSPEFLYHWELDAAPVARDGAVVKLGNYEIANRLSYLLWGTLPDDSLFAAAAAGQLGDLSSVELQVRRMLKDPKAADTFADFFSDWLDLDRAPGQKDASAYPQYTDALAAAMTEEARRFVTAILVDGTGRFDEILTGTSSFANQDLATLYGIAGVTSSALGPVSWNAAERSGLFTSAAFLSLTGAAASSEPSRRGQAVFEKLLCGALPTPPAMPAAEPAAPGNGTTRQRFEQSGSMACAVSCHAQIDPLGFAFENYDGIGAYRVIDNGAAVDASVTVTLDGQATTVADARGLMTALVSSDQAQTCFARQWLRYGLGRLDGPSDRASLNAAASAFKNSQRDIRELVVAVATSRTFRYRTPGTGEVLP